jgi:hypothetical protein
MDVHGFFCAIANGARHADFRSSADDSANAEYAGLTMCPNRDPTDSH